MRTASGAWGSSLMLIVLLTAAACVDDKASDITPPRPDGGTASSSEESDAGTSSGEIRDASDDAGRSETGPTGCAVEPTPFPCGGAEPPNACYGAVQSCTLTGCSGPNDGIWSCTVASNCGRDGLVCCLPSSVATVTLGTDCNPGKLTLTSASGIATRCSPTCEDAAQLCGADDDCPDGKRCKPLTVTGGGASINGNRVGVCAS